ncbi:MAG: murein biosynthesis integral membrane protein MurJ [Bdellovibrionales bacterium]|nr:murein biosynthesis integral membrane protein MurJ [Bdellovibrionales bacterium]
MEELKKDERNQSVILSAGLMSLGTLGSRILGLLRDVVLAAFFSRTVTDAFVVAFSFPNKFRRLLGEGSLSVSFIPVYIEAREKTPEQAQQLSHGIFTLLVLVSSLLCVLGIIFMEPIMELLVGGKGFISVAGKLDITIFLARIMFSYLFLVSTYAFCMALLQAHQQFFLAALAPALFNLTFIILAMLPIKGVAVPGTLLAWAVIFGGVVQAITVIIPLWRQNLMPKLIWRWKSKKVLMVLKNMVPGIIGMGVLQFLTLVNINYASQLSEGSHSYIYWADRILELPQSLIAISLGAALLPTLSQLWAKDRKTEMLKQGQDHFLTLLFLAMPSAVGMYVLAQPIVEVLYLRGRFTLQDAVTTAEVVKIYSVLLVAVSLSKVVVPNFYAVKNTWLPAITSVLSIVCHIVLAYFLVKSHGLNGLIISMTISGYINLILTMGYYQKLIGPLQWKYLSKNFLHFIPALLAMGIFAKYFYEFFIGMSVTTHVTLQKSLVLLVTIALSIVIYFVVSSLTKVPQADKVLRRLKVR